MKQLNLNNMVRIKLNERGMERTKRQLHDIENDPNLTDTSKMNIIKLRKSQIDENGYITAKLNEIMYRYTPDYFESQIALVYGEEGLEELNLNNMVTIKLNERGMEKTKRDLHDIENDPNLTDTSKMNIIKLRKSQIDENGYITAKLNEIMYRYTPDYFESQVIVVHEREEDLNNTESKSK